MGSSIHIATGASGYLSHNSRETSTSNTIFFDEKNYCSHSTKDAFALYREELNTRTLAYSNRTGQKLQKGTLTHLSAIVNLNSKHGSADLNRVVDLIEKSLDTKVFQYAIHRDEGHIADDGKAVKNYHAHIEFLGLDSEGASVRKKLTRKTLSDLQTEVAKTLGMERGRNFNQEWTQFKSGELKEKPTKARRLDTYDFKQAKALEQTARLATVKEVELGYKAEREALKQSGQATQKDYQDLKKEFDAFKELAKAKDLTVETLELRLSEAKQTTEKVLKSTTKLFKSVTFDNQQAPTDTSFFDYVAEEREMLKEKLAAAELRAAQLNENREKVQELKKQLSQALESKKELVESNRTLLTEKIDLRASQSVLIAENTALKEEVSKWKGLYSKICTELKKLTKLDTVVSAIDKVREKFATAEPKQQKIETVEEFKQKLEARQVRTTTHKIRAEIRASNEPQSLKDAKEDVIDEFEKNRMMAMFPKTSPKELEEMRLTNRGLTLQNIIDSGKKQEQEVKAPKKDRGYER